MTRAAEKIVDLNSLPRDDRVTELQACIAEGFTLKSQLDALEGRAKANKTRIMELMVDLNLKKVEDPEQGKVTLIQTTRETLNKERLQRSMLRHDVPPDTVLVILNEATIQHVTAYVRLTPKGGK